MLVTHCSSPFRHLVAVVALTVVLVFPPIRSQATIVYADHYNALPITAPGVEQVLGDFVYTGDGYYGVFSSPQAGGKLDLKFYGFALNGDTVAGYPKALSATDSFYEPQICWNGVEFGVAYSTFTRGRFLVLAPNGNVLVGPIDLPDIPSGVGQRTAAFKPVWTGEGYAIFGLILLPEYPGQTMGNYYCFLHYWFLDPGGNVIVSRDLRNLSPVTYPTYNGEEPFWYDVVWTGGAFFLAYYAEPLGATFTTLYAMMDLDGNPIRAEALAFATTDAVGPRVAWSGATFAVTGLKVAGLEGNKMYVRFFNAAGNPLANESQFGSQYGAGPIISWQGDKFVAAYGMPADMMANWGVVLKTFSANGGVIDADYLLVKGNSVNLLFDLKLVGDGERILFKGQYTETTLDTRPVVYPATGDVNIPSPPCLVCPRILNGFQDNAPVAFQWLPAAKNNNYRLQMANNPQFNTPLYDKALGTTPKTAFDLSQIASGQGVAPGTKLYWRVKGSSTSYTVPCSFTVDPNIWIDPLTLNITVPPPSGQGSPQQGFDSFLSGSSHPEARLAKIAAVEKALAERSVGAVQVFSINRQGTPQYIRGKFALQSKLDLQKSVRGFLNDIKDVLKVEEADKEFTDLSSFSDNLGHSHYRFDQTFQGIPIWGARLHVHLDKAGDVYAINGFTFPTPDKAVRPILDAGQAEMVARGMAGRSQGQCRTQMVWYPAEDDLHLSWKVDLDEGVAFNSTYFVDATTGRVYTYFSNIQSAYPGIYTTGTVTTSMGRSVTVPLYKYTGVYQPVLRTAWYDNSNPLAFSVVNARGDISQEGVTNYAAHGVFLLLKSSQWVPGHRYAADLYNFASTAVNEPMVADLTSVYKIILDFYKNRWGWRSWNNKGGGIVTFCHVPHTETGAGYDNAYFSPPGYFVFGDGSDPTNRRIFSAADDVVAHEFTHGVTDSSSKLIYQYMEGAANEAMSDIIPQGIDRGDWLLGEDLVKTSDTALVHRWVRSLQDPTWGGAWDPDHLDKGGQPAHMNNFWLVGPSRDNGGVHVNSGIINKAGYELASRTSRDTMVDIFFRANTVYLTPAGQFIDVRRACIQAAMDLFPGQAAKVTAVRQAFDAVGVADAGTVPGPVLNTPADCAALTGQVSFSWSPISGAKYYLLELSVDADFLEPFVAMVPITIIQTPTPSTSFTLEALGAPGSKWYWRVRSDQSNFSATREFTYGNTFVKGIAHVFVLYSQGAAPVTVKSITKQGSSPWLSLVTDTLPNQVSTSNNRLVQVIVNPTGLAPGTYTEKIRVYSSMTTRNPYPNGVTVNLTVPSPRETAVNQWSRYQ